MLSFKVQTFSILMTFNLPFFFLIYYLEFCPQVPPGNHFTIPAGAALWIPLKWCWRGQHFGASGHRWARTSLCPSPSPGSLSPGGKAAQASMAVGDWVLSIDGKNASSSMAVGDWVLSVDGENAGGLIHIEAQNKIHACGESLSLGLRRAQPPQRKQQKALAPRHGSPLPTPTPIQAVYLCTQCFPQQYTWPSGQPCLLTVPCSRMDSCSASSGWWRTQKTGSRGLGQASPIPSASSPTSRAPSSCKTWWGAPEETKGKLCPGVAEPMPHPPPGLAPLALCPCAQHAMVVWPSLAGCPLCLSFCSST